MFYMCFEGALGLELEKALKEAFSVQLKYHDFLKE